MVPFQPIQGHGKWRIDAGIWRHMTLRLSSAALWLALWNSPSLAQSTGETSPPERVPATMASLIQRSDQGDVTAMNALGLRYLQGAGVPENGGEAIRWFKQAVSRGSAEGATNLGRAYFRGRGIPFNQAEALKWFQVADQLQSGKPVSSESLETGASPVVDALVASALKNCPNPKPKLPEALVNAVKGGEVSAVALMIGGVHRDVYVASGPRAAHDSVINSVFENQCSGGGNGIYERQFRFTVSDDFRPANLFAAELGDRWSRVLKPAFNANWAGLNPAQQRLVRARYNRLPAAYEPPYPLDGLGLLVEGIRIYAEHWRWVGKFYLEVAVGADGLATGVKVLEAPTDKARQYAASLAINTKFKAARCNGMPCAMMFPLDLEIVSESIDSGTTEELAEKGLADAQNTLGERFKKGSGVEKNAVVALQWFRKAATQGHLTGQHNLARMLEDGRGTEKNEKEALTWYRAAAEKDFAPAQNSHGLMLSQGKGTATHLEEAAKWFSLSAAQGLPDAQFNLAQAYLKGQGVKADLDEAQNLLQRALDSGHDSSAGLLVLMRLLGLSDAAQTEEARVHVLALASNRDASAAALAGMLYARGVDVPRSEAKAFQLFTQAAEAGHVAGQILLAESYATGRGSTPNRAQAIHWYERAAAQGHPFAARRLSELLEQGQAQAGTQKLSSEQDEGLQVLFFYCIAEREGQQQLLRYRQPTPAEARLALQQIHELRWFTPEIK